MEENEEPGQPNNVFLFRLAISNSFKRIAESVSEETFMEKLSILKSKPKIVKKLHKAMVLELYESMNECLEDILTDGPVLEGLQRVAELSDIDSSVTEHAWRPPGNVALHLRSLDAHKIKKENDILEKQVNIMEEENDRLMKIIVNKRSTITTMNENMMRCLSKSSNVIEALEKRLETLQAGLTILDDDRCNIIVNTG